MNVRHLIVCIAALSGLLALNCSKTPMPAGDSGGASAGPVAAAPAAEANAAEQPAKPADVTLEVENFTLAGAVVKDHASASGGKAVAFNAADGKAETEVQLEPGNYNLTLIVNAEDGDQDATNVQVNSGEVTRLYPESWGEFAVCQQTVTFKVEAAGMQKIVITPAEQGSLLDKVTIAKMM